MTTNLPAGYVAAHPNAAVKVTMTWTDAGAGQSDYDLYVFNNPRKDCNPSDCSQPSGSNPADYQSASGNNPETAIVSPLYDGLRKYTVMVIPFMPSGETVTVKMELLPGSASAAVPGFGGADASAPGVPRYLNFYAPKGTSAEAGSGEFNIGYNPATGRIMTMNSGPVWRITPPEVLKPAKPECCEGLWEDKSAASTSVGLDPILWTDQKSGRTFVSNSTAGANAVYAYSDTDGDSYVEGGASPPNGGADHQTIGSGPYPASLAALATPVNQGEAVYYCSQDIVGPAGCQRSDTLGASYGPGVLAYDGTSTECGGLHGHLHVAPDGTAWLPVNQCNGKQGGALTTDGGTTWKEFIVPGAKSQQNGADPSIAIDSDSTVYYSYVNNEPVAAGQAPEGHPRVKVGKRNADNSVTWTNDFDLGASHGIKNAAQIEAVGGSSGRAAVGFIATDLPGDYQALSFQGKWYAFVATTYDGGKTWVTVNATPNDPVQSRTGVWQQGGGAQDRNLLDFNEMTVDKRGRALYGYSDGCVTTGCISDTAPNDFVAYMRVARQSGGKSLFASNDAATDTTAALTAKPPCLSGTRDAACSVLMWKAPDNGGAEITNYYIYRGTVAGGEDFTTPLGQTGTAKTSFVDATANPNVPDYFYVVKAINSVGIGAGSNEIDLKVVSTPVVPESACALPGLTILIDPAGDELDQLPSHDLRHLWVAEPSAFDGKLVFTLKVESLATLPANTQWPVSFTAPDGKNYTVRMTTVPADDPTNPAITTVPEFQVGLTAGPFAKADAKSNYKPDGTITIVVAKTAIGNPQVGQALTGFLSRIRVSGLVVNPTPDNMPDGLTPAGSYTSVGNVVGCAPNAAPTATLTGSPDHGPAPLTVAFTGAGTDPDNDAIASFTFDFGDGSAPVTQSSATITHTYNAAGEFTAQLRVTDARGKISTNTALFPIDVNAVLRNISTRGNVQTGDNVMIGGLIITGNAPRTIVLRGIGPSAKLPNGQPVAGSMQDPTIELHDANSAIAANDNWKTDDATGQSQQTAVENTGLAPTDDRESVIVKSLSPGLYTVILRGKGASTGLAVVEAYDVDPTGISKLGNLSTRALVSSGDNIVIGGFIIGPSNAANMKLLLRGIGPSLSNSGVTNALQDPVLDVRDVNGNRIGANDNWQDSQKDAIQATGIPPSDAREAAILYPEIAPGVYTVLLSGKDNPGVGSVEIYNVP
ncbi:MAG: PKD domain-containing protein [Verrucomicrobiota bacterium]|nr:PKD domain-containing protein [Verrucomicrobiota bacterium]